MPIKGISDLNRLPRLGKIRLGEKSDKGYPTKTDHFVCPAEVQEVFGAEPTELRIMFPSEDNEQWASQWYRCYSQTRGLICKGNGEQATALVDVKTGEIASKESNTTELREVSCDPETCEHYQQKRCRRVMNLQFLIPEVPGLGIWQLDTTSFHSIVSVNSCIRLIKMTCGRISGIPLTLVLEPREVQPGGKKQKVWTLTIRANVSIASLLAGEHPQLLTIPAKLPDSDNEAPDDIFPQDVLEETGEETPTKEQIAKLHTLAINKGLVEETKEYMFREFLKVSDTELTKTEASKVIELLEAGAIKKKGTGDRTETPSAASLPTEKQGKLGGKGEAPKIPTTIGELKTIWIIKKGIPEGKLLSDIGATSFSDLKTPHDIQWAHEQFMGIYPEGA